MTTATLDRDMATPVAFDPPGPGAWALDADHQASPRGTLMQELFAPNFVAGTRTCFGRYGMPLDRLEGRHVNGWFYIHPVPAGVPDNGKQPPPAAVLKLATRLLPELRRRRRVAADTIAVSRWVADAHEWAAERKRWLTRSFELLSTDLVALDDIAFAEHLARSLELATAMARRHFELLGTAVGVGRLLTAGAAWGLDTSRIIPVLGGGSPATTESRAPLVELAGLITGRPQPMSIGDLRAVSPRADELVDHYMRRFGWCPLAADIEATTLIEHPEQLIELVRAQQLAHQDNDPQARLDDLKAGVPVTEHPRLDQLVAEARECYAALDDNSGVLALTVGVLRRDALEAARRGLARGALDNAGDVFNLTPTELQAVAGGDDPVDRGELARRRQARQQAARQAPPPVIGGPVVEPPPPSVFPAPIAELAAAVGAYLDLKFTPRPERPAGAGEPTGSLTVDGSAAVSGLAVVPGEVTGRIVVSLDASDAVSRIEPGDILVCPYTIAAHNSIFPMLGGVVTQFGGPLGHTAVLAREFGIPAIVGCRSLPAHLDGATGTLTAAG